MPTVKRDVPLSEVPKPWLKGVDMPTLQPGMIASVVINIDYTVTQSASNRKLARGRERLERLRRLGTQAGDVSQIVKDERQSYSPRTFDLA